MKRRLLILACVPLGIVALWLVLFSPALFLVAVVIGLVIRLVLVMEQRDQAQIDLAAAWFKIADLEHRQSKVAQVPLMRFGKGTW